LNTRSGDGTRHHIVENRRNEQVMNPTAIIDFLVIDYSNISNALPICSKPVND
jgi:hypothetical protein